MKDQHTKITGYRDLSQEEIDLMNDIKAEAEVVRKLVGRIHNIILDDIEIAEGDGDATVEYDAAHWAELAQKDLQVGFMKLVRSIARPDSF